ncbi:MAG: lysophospholipid acyltransferase family protein [Nitrospirota bacterium]|nr:lysophospholipid acyltransferase family protein [Nitrospirota bacterium]
MMRARVLSFIGWLLISLWSKTLRIAVLNAEIPKRLSAEGRNFIYAFWHGRQFLLLYAHRNSHIVIPASESRDGEIQAGILQRFEYDVVRGSSKRKGERALLGMVEGLRKGKCVALAVDGPRGPIYEVKQGITYLAGKLDKPIVPVIMSAKKAWILDKIWDKYMLPKPFTRCVIMYGSPVHVSGISDEELERKRHDLAQAINELMARADQYWTAS